MGISSDGNLKICEFGTGDILVSTVKESADALYENGIAFTQQEPRPIGEWTNENNGKSLGELKSDVWLIFNKVESVDVVIEHLQLIRSQMIKAQKITELNEEADEDTRL